MLVTVRQFEKCSVGALDCLGAVATSEGVIAGFPVGTTPDDIRKSCQDTRNLRQIGRGLLATLPPQILPDAVPVETGLFAGKNTLVAIRNGETAAATADWLQYHATMAGAEAALIVDRDAPGSGFARDLAAHDPRLPTTIVSFNSPLGAVGAPDARHAALAPAAPKRDLPAPDPWHAPLAETVVLELLRHRFLSKAQAVALLNISDLILPTLDSTVFDLAQSNPGKIVSLLGLETYPWRLRQGAPAPHGDHIAVRRDEKRWLASWCAAPAHLPADAIWQPARPMGVPAAQTRPAQFRRAMGVVFPAIPVNELVRKSDLVEDPELVSLMPKAFDHRPIRLPSSAKIPARPTTTNVTVVSAMKNEGPFVLDWIAHNRAIGIDRHLVYTNDCADGTDDLLTLLAEAGVTQRDNPFRDTGKVPQHAAFRAAETEEAVTSADWLMTLDVDEYLNIHAGDGRIADLLAAVPAAHVISMPWRLFGNGDIHGFQDRPVTEQFTHAAPEFAPRPLQAWAFKSLFQNAGLFRRLGVHRPKGIAKATQGQIKWVDGSGRPISPATWKAAWRMSKVTWGYDLATVNHYAVRSAESFLVKRDRGRVNHTTRDQGLAYWFRMNHNAEIDTSISRLADRVGAEKLALLALPGVAEAHDRAVAWHCARVAQLLTVPEMADFYAEITSPRMEKLSRMTTSFGSNVFLEGPHVIPDSIVSRDPSQPFFFTVDREKQTV